MKKEELLDLITVTKAAELRGVSQQAITDLIRRGRLHTVEIAGKRLLRRSEVLAFKKEKGGRPSTKKEASSVRKTREKSTANPQGKLQKKDTKHAKKDSQRTGKQTRRKPKSI
jgi:excisionase family DNA binding protein